MYKVVGIIDDKIRIEFSNQEEPYKFQTKEEAIAFKQHIQENELCPDGCELQVEEAKDYQEN